MKRLGKLERHLHFVLFAGSKVGAVVGGVVGSIVFIVCVVIVICILVAIYLKRRKGEATFSLETAHGGKDKGSMENVLIIDEDDDDNILS